MRARGQDGAVHTVTCTAFEVQGSIQDLGALLAILGLWDRSHGHRP